MKKISKILKTNLGFCGCGNEYKVVPGPVPKSCVLLPKHYHGGQGQGREEGATLQGGNRSDKRT